MNRIINTINPWPTSYLITNVLKGKGNDDANSAFKWTMLTENKLPQQFIDNFSFKYLLNW